MDGLIITSYIFVILFRNESLKMSSMNNPEAIYKAYIGKILQLNIDIIKSCFKLFSEGHSVPFIARYRANLIQNIPVEKIFSIQSFYKKFLAIETKRNSRIDNLSKKGLLSNSLRKSFCECVTMDQLDELWEPFKTAKKDSDILTAFRIPSLQQMANSLLLQHENSKQYFPSDSPDYDLLPSNFNLKKGILLILIHNIANDPEIRNIVREFISPVIVVKANFKSKISSEQIEKSNFRFYGKCLVFKKYHIIFPFKIFYL